MLCKAFVSTWLITIPLTVWILSTAHPHARVQRSVLNGVYTEEQAVRGRAVFLAESCVRCHGETLVGNEFGPSLVGNEFMEKWSGMTASDLFTLIKDTMPQDNPGRLSGTQSADLLSYILKENGFPAGQTTMSSDPAALKGITIAKVADK
jgi:cytochrome c